MEKTLEASYVIDMYEALLSVSYDDEKRNDTNQKNNNERKKIAELKLEIDELNKKVSWLRLKRDEYKLNLDESTSLITESELKVKNSQLELENRELKIAMVKKERDFYRESLNDIEKKLKEEVEKSLGLAKKVDDLQLILSQRKKELKIASELKIEVDNLKLALTKKDENLASIKEESEKNAFNVNKYAREIEHQFQELEKIKQSDKELKAEFEEVMKQHEFLLQEKSKEHLIKVIAKKSWIADTLYKLSKKLMKLSKYIMLRSTYVKGIREEFSAVEDYYHKQYPDIENEDWLKHIIENGFVERRLEKRNAPSAVKKLKKRLTLISTSEGM